MISINIKEEKEYSEINLIQLFNCSNEKFNEILGILIKFNIVKVIKFPKDDDFSFNFINEVYNIKGYKFSFVGVIIIKDIVIRCYPKYMNYYDDNHFRIVLDILEKFDDYMEIGTPDDFDDFDSTYNFLPLMLFFMVDYFENGLYENFTNVIEINGNGEIQWEKTINDTNPLLKNNAPFYINLVTKKRINDFDNYFRHLHMVILTACSKILKEHFLLDLFKLTEINLTDEILDDLDDDAYILNKIKYEMNTQFNTHKLILLKAMYSFILKKDTILNSENYFATYGTTSFSFIWEKICCSVFNDLKNKSLNEISLPHDLNRKFKENKNLLSIIDNPTWNILDDKIVSVDNKSRSLRPDLITICKNGVGYDFIILDAKYYDINKNKPGIESITKQCLYELAFKDFIELHNFQNIKNCFLFPIMGDEIINFGVIEWKMFKELGLHDIQLILLPVDIIYQIFLNNKVLNISELL